MLERKGRGQNLDKTQETQSIIMKRVAVPFIALVNMLLCCHAANESVKVRPKKRRMYLESKSSKKDPLQMPPVGNGDATGLLDEQPISTESLSPTDSPVKLSAPPTDRPLAPASSPASIKVNQNNLQAQTLKNEATFLSDDIDEQQRISWMADKSTSNSTKMAQPNNVLAYGLVSVSAVLVLATIGLIASRRRNIIEERRKSLVLQETGSTSLDDDTS